MRKFFEFGGLVAAVILIAFGERRIVMGINGGNTVKDSLKLEQITGTPDMTPAAIKAEATKAGLDRQRSASRRLRRRAPDQQRLIAPGLRQYMRIHTLEATGGVPYAMMPRYATADGKGTNDATKALCRTASRWTTRPATSGSPRRRSPPLSTRATWPADGALRDRGRHRAPAHRVRLRDPLDLGCTPEPRDRTDLVREASHDGGRDRVSPPSRESL